MPLGGDSKVVEFKDKEGEVYETRIIAPQQAFKVPDDFKYNEKEFEVLVKLPRKRYNITIKSDGRKIRGSLKEFVDPNTGQVTPV